MCTNKSSVTSENKINDVVGCYIDLFRKKQIDFTTPEERTKTMDRRSQLLIVSYILCYHFSHNHMRYASIQIN